MKRPRSRLLRAFSIFGIGTVITVFFDAAAADAATLVLNPYAEVDWDSFEHHKAALHMHTLQSDGYAGVNDTILAYRDAGFTILSITDHDTHAPNRHVEPGGRADIPAEKASPYPKDPVPENFPANTTWPWTDYGAPSPESLGMVGIEGNEISIGHVINSYFNDAGFHRDMDVFLERRFVDGRRIPVRDMEGWERVELDAVRERGGMAIFIHPGLDNSWWTRRHPDWYVEHFRDYPADMLVGIEVTNTRVRHMNYDIGLWDQILARLMPDRPTWGFGNDDLHRFRVRETHTVFVLPYLTSDAVRQAMESGTFYFRYSTRTNDLREREPASELFPVIRAIHVDEEAGTITIDASNVEEIRWISAPESLEPTGDFMTENDAWPMGRVVQEGATLDYRNTPGIERYVRIELERRDGRHRFLVFTNPFGFAVSGE